MVTSILDSLNRVCVRIYKDLLQKFVRAAGVERSVKRAYWAVLLTVSDDVWELSVGDAKAEFPVDSKGEFQRFTRGFEEETLERFVDEIEPDDVFYDIGANIGLYTCIVGDSITDGEVCSFEPSPANVEALQRNIDRNGVPATVYEYALSNENAEIELTFSAEVGDSGTVKGRGGLEQTVTVASRTVDSLVDDGDIPVPNVVKIDVEGAEYDVLDGMHSTLEHDECRCVQVELHPNFLQDQNIGIDSIETLFRQHGFDVERGKHLWATKESRRDDAGT